MEVRPGADGFPGETREQGLCRRFVPAGPSGFVWPVFDRTRVGDVLRTLRSVSVSPNRAEVLRDRRPALVREREEGGAGQEKREVDEARV